MREVSCAMFTAAFVLLALDGPYRRKSWKRIGDSGRTSVRPLEKVEGSGETLRVPNVFPAHYGRGLKEMLLAARRLTASLKQNFPGRTRKADCCSTRHLWRPSSLK